MAEYVNIVIPENADKFLFAEDLIRTVMLGTGSNPQFTRRAGPYRQYIHNGFNATTEVAVRILYRYLASGYSRTFQYVRNLNAMADENYARVVNDIIIARCFPDGFQLNRFLFFCTHIASLAVNLDASGVKEAADLAVLSIVKPIQDIDMTTGGWALLSFQVKPVRVLLRTITGANDKNGEAQKNSTYDENRD